MKNLFKFIGHYWKAVIAIVAILAVQAYCCLLYTSNRSERIENRLVCLERNGNSAPNCALALRTEKLEERVEALERKVS